jgi:tetratricopeptide (TPR) repeat protein
MQPTFASALTNTGKIMGGSYLGPSPLAIGEQPELIAFFEDLERIAPLLVQEAEVGDLGSLHRMGVACRLCNQFDLAEKFYARALEVASAAFGADSMEAATHRNFLAGLYFVGGRFDRAIILIEVSLHAYQKVLGPDHIYSRLTEFGLALAFIGVGDVHRSRHHYLVSALGSMQTTEAQSDEQWSAFSAKLAALAAAKYEQGRFDEAVELFRHCVIHEANEAWPGSLVVARSLTSLAVLCRSQNLDQEAAEFYRMALQMKKTLCGEAHPEYQMTWKHYQELLTAISRRSAAN